MGLKLRKQWIDQEFFDPNRDVVVTLITNSITDRGNIITEIEGEDSNSVEVEIYTLINLAKYVIEHYCDEEERKQINEGLSTKVKNTLIPSGMLVYDATYSSMTGPEESDSSETRRVISAKELSDQELHEILLSWVREENPLVQYLYFHEIKLVDGADRNYVQKDFAVEWLTEDEP